MKEKYQNGYIENVDEKNKVIKFSVYGGSHIFNVAKEAIAILAENPDYAAVRFTTTCSTCMERDYVVVPGMTLADFQEEFKKEDACSSEAREESKKLTADMPQHQEIAKIDGAISDVQGEIAKAEAILKALREKVSGLQKQKDELDSQVRSVENAHWSKAMQKYYAAHEEFNKKRIEAAKASLENAGPNMQ